MSFGLPSFLAVAPMGEAAPNPASTPVSVGEGVGAEFEALLAAMAAAPSAPAAEKPRDEDDATADRIAAEAATDPAALGLLTGAMMVQAAVPVANAPDAATADAKIAAGPAIPTDAVAPDAAPAPPSASDQGEIAPTPVPAGGAAQDAVEPPSPPDAQAQGQPQDQAQRQAQAQNSPQISAKAAAAIEAVANRQAAPVAPDTTSQAPQPQDAGATSNARLDDAQLPPPVPVSTAPIAQGQAQSRNEIRAQTAVQPRAQDQAQTQVQAQTQADTPASPVATPRPAPAQTVAVPTPAPSPAPSPPPAQPLAETPDAATSAESVAPRPGTPVAPEAAAPAPTPAPVEPLRNRRDAASERTVSIAHAAPDASTDAVSGEVAASPSAFAASPAEAPAAAAGRPLDSAVPVVAPPAALVEMIDAQAEPLAPGTTPVDQGAPVERPGVPTSTLSRVSIEATAQIAAQIIRKLEGRSTRFEMALTPDDLGRVDVSLEIGADGALAARLAFDNPAAAAELRGRADELRRQLQDAGFQLAQDSLQFAERDASGSGRGFDRRQDRAFSGAARLTAQTDAAAPAPGRWIPLTVSPQGVDLKV